MLKNKESTWSIGNSVNSDLIPAKKAGINNLIWIDSHVWEYEKYKKLNLDSSIIKKQEFSLILEEFC